MIKIICSNCGSDEIFDIGDESNISEFRCDNCDYEFTLNIGCNSWEFDTK